MHFKGFKRYTPSNPIPKGFPMENLSNPNVSGLSQEFHRFLMSKQDFGGQGVIFEQDEEGRCWYTLRDEFEKDTWKVVYDPSTLKVISYSQDAHTLFPHGNNIIEVDKLPADIDLDFWRIDVVKHTFTKCDKLVSERNKGRQSSLLASAVNHLTSLQLDEDKSEADEKLEADLKRYIVALRKVDLVEPLWPDSPLN